MKQDIGKCCKGPVTRLLCKGKAVADTADGTSSVALPVVRPRCWPKLPEAVLRRGGSARHQAARKTGSHQFRIGPRNGQQPVLQPDHRAAPDSPAKLRLGATSRQHVAPQQHSSGGLEDVYGVHQATLAAIGS